MPVLLLMVFSVSVSVGIAVVIGVLRAAGKQPLPRPVLEPSSFERPCLFHRPDRWLAVRSRNVFSVQTALGLANPKPCPMYEGLAGEQKLFIAPPVGGWILVVGSGLPDPGEDVDACFKFLLNASRKLGRVQFFNANPVLHHHAWVRADHGRIQRAYAWAGRTLWAQGGITPAEKLLDLQCFDYSDPDEAASVMNSDSVVSNVDKVPLLAARWSLDPARIEGRLLENEKGVSGDPNYVADGRV